jgi:predicted O-methyltransferase YrrM
MIFGQILSKSKLLLKKTYNEIDTYLHAVMEIDGQISSAEARKLIELAQSAPSDTMIVEIGTYRGRSTVALAFGSLLGNHNQVYAVDPHVEFQGAFGGQFGPDDQAELYRNLVKAGVGHIVAVVGLPSVSAASGWQARNVGILWIDGDHRYEAVKADYEAWRPFVVEDGIIAFHDTHAPGVKQLIQELVTDGWLTSLGKLGALSWFRLGHR